MAHFTFPITFVSFICAVLVVKSNGSPIELLEVEAAHNSTMNTNLFNVTNERKPICSFHLGQNTHPRKPATVTFLKNQSGRFLKYYVTIDDTRCINTSTDWVKYADAVQIKVNNRTTSNFIKIFSDIECMVEIFNGTHVQDGADLAALTRKNSVNMKN